jgi:hypothetical protein
MIRTSIKQAANIARWNRKDLLILSLLTLVNCIIMLNSSSVMDTARDVYHAWQIATASSFPLEGSLLAGSIHSGPIWFYVLAIPLLLNKSWIAVSLWVGLLSGMKFFLAYACGNRLGNPRFGIIWACLLALPNWTAINFLIFTHINLVETTVLLSIYSLIRWQQGEQNWFLVMCFSLGLGLHAHASVYALAVAFLPVVLVSLYRKRLGWRYLGGGALLAALPLLPYLLSQSLRQWPDFHTTRSYFESQPFWHNLLGYFDVLHGTFVDGTIVALRHVLNLQGTMLLLVYILISIILIAGFCFAIYAILRKTNQTPAKLLLAATLVIVASVSLIREITPYYMVLVIYPPAYGLIAWGWSSLRIPSHWPIRGMFTTISLIFLIGFFVKTTEWGHLGHLKVSGLAAYNVRTHAVNDLRDSLYFPAWARQQLGTFVCMQEKPAFFHGSASLMLEQSYGLEAQMLCETNAVYIGGKGAGSHFIGISQWEATNLGIKTPIDTIGPLSLLAVTTVIEPDQPEPLPSGDLYPPRPFFHSKDQEYLREFSADSGELIAITNLYHYWMPYSFEVSLNGNLIEPLFASTQTSYYACGACAVDELQNWRVTITAPKPELVEIVTFTVPE